MENNRREWFESKQNHKYWGRTLHGLFGRMGPCLFDLFKYSSSRLHNFDAYLAWWSSSNRIEQGLLCRLDLFRSQYRIVKQASQLFKKEKAISQMAKFQAKGQSFSPNRSTFQRVSLTLATELFMLNRNLLSKRRPRIKISVNLWSSAKGAYFCLH